jgi:hypothetical protein
MEGFWKMFMPICARTVKLMSKSKTEHKSSDGIRRKENSFVSWPPKSGRGTRSQWQSLQELSTDFRCHATEDAVA